MKFVQHFNATKQLFLQKWTLLFGTVFMILFWKEFCIKQLYKLTVIPNFCPIFFFQNTIVIESLFTDIINWDVYSQWNVYFFPFFHSLSVRLPFAYCEFIVCSFTLLAHRVGIRKVDIMRSLSPLPNPSSKTITEL